MELNPICKRPPYAEISSMRSNVNALEIQCKRPRNTGSGKFQRGPRAVKISRYIHQPSFSQEPTMMVKESNNDDDDDGGDDDDDGEGER